MTWRLGREFEHEGKHLSADGEGKRDDEQHEKCHLCYEKQEDLEAGRLAEFSRMLEGVW